MTEVKKDIKETAAADSLKPGSMDGSKSVVMSKLMAVASAMSIEDISKMLDPVLAQVGKEADAIPDAWAGHNLSTITAKGMKEDVDLMFGDELSVELKEKATTLFEAAVNARLQVEVVQIKEALEKTMSEQVAAQVDSLAEAVDKYVAAAAETWLEENEVAVNNALKVEIMEEFIESMKKTFAEHYITVPNEKVDLVDNLVKKAEELEARVNKLLNDNIELKASLESHDSAAVFESVAGGMTDNQKEKFRKLTENIQFKSTEEFTKKLGVIKEAYFSDKKAAKTGILNEDAGVKDPKELAEETADKTKISEETDPIVQAISDYMSKSKTSK